MLLRVVLVVIGVAGIIAAALSPVARIFGLPLTVLSLLILASLMSRAGKLVTRLGEFKGQPVTILLEMSSDADWPWLAPDFFIFQRFGALGGQPDVSTPNCFAYSAFSRCQPPNFIASPPTMRPMEFR